MTNLIQNYVNNIGQGVNSIGDTTKKYYNNLTDPNSASLLKPLDGKGYLVENNLATAPKEFAHDTYYSAKSLADGVSGKANDHELGKLNDLGLKLGGLGIAAYLMTKAKTTKTKAMEFVGFGSFLASMAIWPKVALQWPAQAIHGFNFRKQYVDEQGRKKFVSQDPNYIPFDLYKGGKKSEDLSAIGDKMGISKDEKDRNELVKDQMRKISVQNNTMWMMTAGVATPVMTALTCNVLEKPIGKFAENYDNNKANKLAYKVNDYINATDTTSPEFKNLHKELITANVDKESKVALDSILKAKTGKALSKSDISDIAGVLSSGFPEDMKEAAETDLQGILEPKGTLVDEKFADKITSKVTKKLDTQYGEGFTSGLFESKKLSEHIDSFMKANKAPADGILDDKTAEALRNSVNGFIKDSAEANKSLSPARKKIISTKSLGAINEAFAESKPVILTEDSAKMICEAGSHLRKYTALDKAISSVSHFKVEEAPETIVANNWGKVSDTVVDALGINKKELEVAKNSPELSAKLFQSKLETLCQDEGKYKEAVGKISKAMSELDTKLDNPTSGKKPVMDIVSDSIIKNCDRTSEGLKGIQSADGSNVFSTMAERISGKFIDGASAGSVKDAKLNRIKNTRVEGVKNSYMRLLNTFDFFRRAEEYKTSGKGGFTPDAKLNDEIIKKGKKVLMSSHSGDFYLKLDTANNPSFYKQVMSHVFNSEYTAEATKDAEGVAKDTHEVFHGSTSMVERMGRWSDKMRNVMGTLKYDFLPAHIIGDSSKVSNIEKTPEGKFNLVASTPAEFLQKTLERKHSSNKWLKIFATVGATVLAVTVASQFAFGKKDKTIQASK